MVKLSFREWGSSGAVGLGSGSMTRTLTIPDVLWSPIGRLAVKFPTLRFRVVRFVTIVALGGSFLVFVIHRPGSKSRIINQGRRTRPELYAFAMFFLPHLGENSFYTR